MTLFSLMQRFNEITDAKIFVEDKWDNRIGRLVWEESDKHWVMFSLVDDAPKFLKQYEILSFQVMAGNVFINVTWEKTE